MANATNGSGQEMDCSDKGPETFSQVIYTSLTASIFVTGLAGNILVMWIMMRSAKMRTITNVLVMNLAVADTLVMVAMPAVMFQSVFGHWPSTLAMCRVLLTVDPLAQFVSVLSMTAMAVDRFLAVMLPLGSTFRSVTKTVVASVLIWAVATLLAAPLAASATVLHTPCGREFCVEQMGDDQYVYFDMLIHIWAYAVPLAAIAVLYAFILHRVHNREIVSANQQAFNAKVTRMVFMVTAAFAICWTPFHFLRINHPEYIEFIHIPRPIFFHLGRASCLLGYANSVVNPVVYTFMSENFRQSFAEVVGSFPPVKSFSRVARSSARRPTRGDKSKNDSPKADGGGNVLAVGGGAAGGARSSMCVSAMPSSMFTTRGNVGMSDCSINEHDV